MKTPDTRAQFAQKVIAAQPTEKMLFNAINVLDQCRVENRTLLEAAKEAWAVMYRAAYPMPVNDVIKPMDVATDFTRDESKPEETPPGHYWTRDHTKSCGWRLLKKPTPPGFNPAIQGYQPVRQDDRPIPPPPGPVDKSKTNAEYVRRLLSEAAVALKLALKGECSQSNGAALVEELKAFAAANHPPGEPTPISSSTPKLAASISKTAEVMDCL